MLHFSRQQLPCIQEDSVRLRSEEDNVIIVENIYQIRALLNVPCAVVGASYRHYFSVLQVFTACEAAKQSNKVACPCAADWKYRGEDYSFCADPNNGGFLWCATQTDEVGGRVPFIFQI